MRRGRRRVSFRPRRRVVVSRRRGRAGRRRVRGYGPIGARM